MNANDILSLLGAPVSDPRVDALFTRLDATERPDIPVDEFRYEDWVLAPAHGVELGFTDSLCQEGAPLYRWGSGEPVLTQVYFYAGYDDVAGFAGELPHGLAFADGYVTAREKLAAFEATRHSWLTDTWDVPGYRLNIAYDEEAERIDLVSCVAMPAPVARLGNPVPPPLAQLLQAFDTPLKPAALKPLWPTGWDDEALGLAQDDGDLDLTDSYGVTLHYGGKAQVLRSIALHRNRDAESAGWAGELPHGLDFEDSPETLLEKVGAEPLFHNDGQAAGVVVWRLDGVDVQVLYSNLHNRLQRVTLYAPASWRATPELDELLGL